MDFRRSPSNISNPYGDGQHSVHSRHSDDEDDEDYDYHQPEDDYYNNSRNADRASFRSSVQQSQSHAALMSHSHSRTHSRDLSLEGGGPSQHSQSQSSYTQSHHSRSLSHGSYQSAQSHSQSHGSYARSHSQHSHSHDSYYDDDDDHRRTGGRGVHNTSVGMSENDTDDDNDDDDDDDGANNTAGQHQHVQVYLRLRPMNKLEKSRRSRNCIELHTDGDDYVQHGNSGYGDGHNANASSPRHRNRDGKRRNSKKETSPRRQRQRRRGSRLGSFSDSESDDSDNEEDDLDGLVDRGGFGNDNPYNDGNDDDTRSMNSKASSTIRMRCPKSLTVDSPLEGQFYDFTFDDIFDAEATQTAVYENAAHGIVRDFVRGYNGCVMTYGQTATGKTHTLLGTDEYVKDQLTPENVLGIKSASTSQIHETPERQQEQDPATNDEADKNDDEAQGMTGEATKEGDNGNAAMGAENEDQTTADAGLEHDSSSPPPSITIPISPSASVSGDKDGGLQQQTPHTDAGTDIHMSLSEESGVIPRAIHDVFDIMRRGPSDVEYTLKCSYVELYLEKLWDLLDPTQPDGTLKHLQLLRPSNGSTKNGSTMDHIINGRVDGVSEACCLTERDVLALLVKGNACRQLLSHGNRPPKHGATASNTSNHTKSHAILTIRLEQRHTHSHSHQHTNESLTLAAGGSSSTKYSTLHLVDLAGSEFATKPEESSAMRHNSMPIGHRPSLISSRHSSFSIPGTGPSTAANSRHSSISSMNVNVVQAAHTARHLIQTQNVTSNNANGTGTGGKPPESASTTGGGEEEENDEEENAAAAVAAAQHEQIRLLEAKLVHKSLSALNRVVTALADGGGDHSLSLAQHPNDENKIPYGYSKLTEYLQLALGGNCRTSVILTASSSQYNIQESLQTFRFGEDAREIWNRAVRVNEYPSLPWYEQQLNSTKQKQMQLLELLRQVRDCSDSADTNATTTVKREESNAGQVLGERSSNRPVRLLSSGPNNTNKRHKRLLHSIDRVIEQDRHDQDKENCGRRSGPGMFQPGYDLNAPQNDHDGENGSDDNSQTPNMTPQEEIEFLKQKLDTTERQRDQAERNVAELQSEIVILRNQTCHANDDCSEFLKQLRLIKKEHQMMQQKKTELEHKLRTSMFRESETTVFFRQFRRFYRRLLKHKAAQGSVGGEGTSDIKEIIGKVPGVPDLSDLIDVDTLLYEAGLIEESERFDDAAAFSFRPSRKSLSMSYKAARRASKRRSAPSNASSLSYAAEMAAKQDQQDGGNKQSVNGAEHLSSMTRQTSIPEHGASSSLPHHNSSSQDEEADEASSVASSVTQSLHRSSYTAGGGGGGHQQQQQGTSAREEQLHEELGKLTDKCVKLQIALTDEKSKWDSITDDANKPLNVRKLQLKTAAYKTELDKKSNDLEAVIWKMNELHLINKTYSEKVSNREQNVSYLEQTLSDVQNQSRNMLMKRHEAEEGLATQMEDLQTVVDTAFRLPLWQFQNQDSGCDNEEVTIMKKENTDADAGDPTSNEGKAIDVNGDAGVDPAASKEPPARRAPLVPCSRNLQSRIHVSLRGGSVHCSEKTLIKSPYDCPEDTSRTLLNARHDRRVYVQDELSSFIKMPVETNTASMQTDETWPDVDAIRAEATVANAKAEVECKDMCVQTEEEEKDVSTLAEDGDDEAAVTHSHPKVETVCTAIQTDEAWPEELPAPVPPPPASPATSLQRALAAATEPQIQEALAVADVTAPPPKLEMNSIAIQTDEGSTETKSIWIQTDAFSCDQACMGTQTETDTLPQHETATQAEKLADDINESSTNTSILKKESAEIAIQTDNNDDGEITVARTGTNLSLQTDPAQLANLDEDPSAVPAVTNKSPTIDTGTDSDLAADLVQNNSPIDVRDVDSANESNPRPHDNDRVSFSKDQNKPLHLSDDPPQDRPTVPAATHESAAVAGSYSMTDADGDNMEVDTTRSVADSAMSQLRNEYENEIRTADDINEQRQSTQSNSNVDENITSSASVPTFSSPMRSSKAKSKESKERRRRERERRKANRTVDVVPPEELLVPMGEEDEVSIITSHFGGYSDGYIGGKPSTYIPKRFAPKLGLAIRPGVVKHHHSKRSSSGASTKG